MLSKLRYWRQASSSDGDVAGVPPEDVAAFTLAVGANDIQAVAGGTLNAGYQVTIGTRQRFAKTPVYAAGATGLSRETAILSEMHGCRLEIETIVVGPRRWLVMNSLSRPSDPSLADILRLTAWHANALADVQVQAIVSRRDDFNSLLSEGQIALAGLVDGGHLGDNAQGWAATNLALLMQERENFPPLLCHGDLGPDNILTDSHGLIAIDWEDVFWGIEGYDYLYWLTFMARRADYAPTMFGHTPWGKDVEIAILVLIIVLKSWLSVLMNRHHYNRISFDQRILEFARFA